MVSEHTLSCTGVGDFFRYGKFTYGVDLGCFWKTSVIVLFTTVSLGVPNYGGRQERIQIQTS